MVGDHHCRPLRDGITLSAKVPLDERKLWDWITEPIERMLSDSEETAEPTPADPAGLPAPSLVGTETEKPVTRVEGQKPVNASGTTPAH